MVCKNLLITKCIIKIIFNLTEASISGNLNEISFCLLNGANINTNDLPNAQTPLIYGKVLLIVLILTGV